MSESTATKSKVYKEDIALATGGTSADETGVRTTSTGGEITLTKVDASHIKFRTLAKSLNDLVDGGHDVILQPSSITMNGTLTNEAETIAGFVRNNASGVYAGGYTLTTADIPTGINAVNIATGIISNTEFEYLNGLTGNIQNQINAAGTTAASQADQETGTEAAKYVAPATQKFHPSAAKAWCAWTGNSTTRLAYYNVGSITDGTNESTVNLDVAFSGTAYAVVATAENVVATAAIICMVKPSSRASGSFIISTTAYTGAPADCDSIFCAAFGDQ